MSGDEITIAEKNSRSKYLARNNQTKVVQSELWLTVQLSFDISAREKALKVVNDIENWIANIMAHVILLFRDKALHNQITLQVKNISVIMCMIQS